MADNRVYQKRANISLVMRTIRSKGEISRIAISRELGLDRSTITNIVSGLIAEDLVIEKSQGVSISKGGRKPVLIGINPRFGMILGLEIQVNFYRATLMSVDGEVFWNKCSHAQKISDIYNELKNDVFSLGIPLLGIGIGIPGNIDPLKKEILENSPFYDKEDQIYNLGELFGVPVVVDNDANCCAWGVLEERKGFELKNFLYSIAEFHQDRTITDKRELEFGIVINGQVYYGSNFTAGKIVDSHQGCSSDSEYIDRLFDIFTFFINFLNPSHLFLGGEFIAHKDSIIEWVTEKGLDRKCEVVFSNLKQFEVSYGAAGMFIERLFKVPEPESYTSKDLNWENILIIRRENPTY